MTREKVFPSEELYAIWKPNNHPNWMGGKIKWIEGKYVQTEEYAGMYKYDKIYPLEEGMNKMKYIEATQKQYKLEESRSRTRMIEEIERILEIPKGKLIEDDNKVQQIQALDHMINCSNANSENTDIEQLQKQIELGDKLGNLHWKEVTKCLYNALQSSQPHSDEQRLKNKAAIRYYKKHLENSKTNISKCAPEIKELLDDMYEWIEGYSRTIKLEPYHPIINLMKRYEKLKIEQNGDKR